MLQWPNGNLLRAFHEGNNTILKFTEVVYAYIDHTGTFLYSFNSNLE